MPANRTERGQFKAGQSGNPSGRPRKNRDFEEKIDAFMAEDDPALGGTRQDIVIRFLYSQALKGEPRELLDRWLGRPRQSVEHSSDAERPIAIVVTEK